ncbi:DUF2207 domain-containing protein [Coriobacterium glomerans]|nr:DUF2207 domain-containing protein [Coriobacterium glomerans]
MTQLDLKGTDMRSFKRLDSHRTRSLMAISLIFACLVIAAAAWPDSAWASTYSLPRTRIEAAVQPNGDVQVSETRTFEFSEYVNGVYWTIPLGENQQGSPSSIAQTGVVELIDGSPHKYLQVDSAHAGQTRVYTVSGTEDSSAGVKLKVFAPASADQSKTFTLSYTISGAVMAWRDTAELYWKFVGPGWEENSQDVQLDVTFPAGSNDIERPKKGESFRAWGHGSLDGGVSVDEAVPSVHYVVPTVSSGKFAEARIAFPRAWVGACAVPASATSTERLPDILSEERSWAQEANRERERARALLAIGTVAEILLPALLLIGVIALKLTRGRNPKPLFQDTYFRDVPSADHPAVISAFMKDGSVGDEAVVATLMKLTDDRVIALSSEHVSKRSLFGSRAVEDYAIRLIDRSAAVDPIDRAAIELYFGPESDGTTEMRFEDLKSLAHADPKEYTARIDDLKAEVSGALCARGFIKSRGVAMKLGAGALALVMFGLDVAFAGMIGWLNIPVIAISIALLVAAVAIAATYRVYSEEGVELRSRCAALKKWLEDFTRLGEAVPADLVLWNKLLVMGVALGVSDEVLRELADAVPRHLREDDQGLYLFPMYWWIYPHGSMGAPVSAMHSVYSATVADVASSMRSSGGGFGGGFSGGGGGGVGGGGGGTF